VGSQSYSESDNGIGEENSDEASNPAQSSSKIVVPMWLEHYALIEKCASHSEKCKIERKARSFLNSQTV
jgi:hypothetical protein